jgi:purine nucleoside phosphorylase
MEEYVKKARIAFIGGSGLYEIEGAKLIEQVDIDTPWGNLQIGLTLLT